MGELDEEEIVKLAFAAGYFYGRSGHPLQSAIAMFLKEQDGLVLATETSGFEDGFRHGEQALKDHGN